MVPGVTLDVGDDEDGMAGVVVELLAGGMVLAGGVVVVDGDVLAGGVLVPLPAGMLSSFLPQALSAAAATTVASSNDLDVFMFDS